MTRTSGERGNAPPFFTDITLLSSRISCHDNPLWNWPQLVFVISVPTSALVSVRLVIPSHSATSCLPFWEYRSRFCPVKIDSSVSITVLGVWFGLVFFFCG